MNSDSEDLSVDNDDLDIPEPTSSFNKHIDEIMTVSNSDPHPIWTTLGLDRDKSFVWDRPPEMTKTDLSISARLAKAEALERKVKQQEIVLKLVAKQLTKANEERFSLLGELDGYRGSARAELYKENQILRERIERITKENIRLRTEMQKSKTMSAKHRRNKMLK